MIFYYFIREKEEDEKKRKFDFEKKRKIRDYYDMQVSQKKMMNAYEKNIDTEQAKIWQIDSERYKEQEKEMTNRVI